MWFEELRKRRADLSQEDVSRLILQNSMRLYRDAKLLRKKGSPQSALALLILSIEELGKFIDFMGIMSAKTADSRLHLKRQLTAACAFMHFSWTTSVTRYFRAQDMSPSERDEAIVKYLSIRDLGEFDALDGNTVGEIIDSGYFAEALVLFSFYHEGTMHNLKNRSIHVDLSADGTIQTPADLPVHIVDKLFEVHDRFLDLCRITAFGSVVIPDANDN